MNKNICKKQIVILLILVMMLTILTLTVSADEAKVGSGISGGSALSISITNHDINLTYGNNEDISISGTISDADNDVTVSATIDGNEATDTVEGGSEKWTLTWDIDDLNIAEGTYEDVTFTADDGNGGTAAMDYAGKLVVDRINPIVTDEYISLSGAAGRDSVFKVGDTVTAEWDDTESGDNNSDISSVTVDFSEFGGGDAVEASESSSIWTAAYTIDSGVTEGTNKNVSVTAVDNAGNKTTTEDTSNVTIEKETTEAPALDVDVSPGMEVGSTKASVTGDATAKFVVNITSDSVATPKVGDEGPTSGDNLIDDYISGDDITEGIDPDKYLQVYDVDENDNVVKFYQDQLTSDDIAAGEITNWADVAGNAKEDTDYSVNDDTYIINTALGLAWVADQVNNQGNSFKDKTVELADDIDLAEYYWTPIGTSENSYYRKIFRGVFDGKGNIIFNVKIGTKEDKDTTFRYVGLFGYAEKAAIQNVGVENCAIYSAKANADAGGLIGVNLDSTIKNSYATGNVEGENSIGGLVGFNAGTIENSYAAGDVEGDYAAGGLVGVNKFDTIANSYATGNVEGDYAVGGLVGFNESGTIANSYAMGNVEGEDHAVGGLVGFNLFGTIANSYAAGNIEGGAGTYVGGLVGDLYDGSILTNGYWRIGAAEKGIGSGGYYYDNIFGMEASEMQTYYFAQSLNKNLSDITGIPSGITLAKWGKDDDKNSGYPVLVEIGDGSGVPSAGTEPLPISSVKNIADIKVNYGTELNEIELPITVKVTLENSSITSLAVNWDGGQPEYKGNNPGDYIFTGTLILLEEGIVNTNNHKAAVKVIVLKKQTPPPKPTPEELANAAITKARGLLPSSFTAIEGTHANLLTYLNDIPGMGATGVTLSLESANYNVDNNGDITYTEEEITDNVVVNINKVHGTAKNKTIAVTVSESIPVNKEITDVKATADINVPYGTPLDELKLPKRVQVTLDDYSVTNLSVNWDMESSTYHSDTPGVYQFTGSLVLEEYISNTAEHKAKISVTVLEKGAQAQEIIDIEAIENVDVPYGTALKDIGLPAAVQVTLADETRQNLAVNWDKGTPEYDANKGDTYEFEGTLVLLEGIANTDEHRARVKVIVKPKSPELDLREDYEALAIGYASGDHAKHVTRNLYLPKVGKSGHTIINWTSSDEGITTTGRVTRPTADEADLTVTLTATITHEISGAQKTKIFTVRLLKKTAKDSIQDAARDLSIAKAFTFEHGDNWECVTSSFTLLDEGLYGTTINWTSNNSGIIQITKQNGETVGSVIRPKTADAKAILTAEISLGEYTITKTFLLVVRNEAVSIDDSDMRQTTSREANVQVGQEGTENKDNVGILRTNLNNGSKIDTVILNQDKLAHLIDGINPDKADEKQRTIMIEIPQSETEPADEQVVEVPAAFLEAMADKNSGLHIQTNEGSVNIDYQELQDVAERGSDLFFRMVSVKDKEEQDEVKNNIATNMTVVKAADGRPINVLSIPRRIETNFRGSSTRVSIPLRGIDIPDKDQQEFLDSMHIFIEHSDGTTELLSGMFQYENDEPVAMEFIIHKFSCFQLLNFYEEDSSDDDHHSSHSSRGLSKDDYVTIYVNGEKEKAGILTTDRDNGKRIQKITIDKQKLEKKLKKEGQHTVVAILFNKTADCSTAILNGELLDDMAKEQAVIEVKTEYGAYTLPAAQIDMETAANQLGKNVKLKDIDVEISIAKLQGDTLNTVEKAAKGNDFTIAASPVDFIVQCSHNKKTIKVSNYSDYVKRSITIPKDLDIDRITTGVIVEPNGSVRHVPTKVIKADGKYYAQINSFTDSTYVLIYHPQKFKDVKAHWAQEAINDMGSRMIVGGVGNNRFEPDRSITRAEFVAIMVRGLGLKPGIGTNPFIDVSEDSWYCDYIKTAYGYDIINGYENSRFKPLDFITREEAMAMVTRAMNITGLKGKSQKDEFTQLEGYADFAQSAPWAKSSINTCVNQGILSGKSISILAPKDKITRAEVAVIIRRLLQKSGLI
ncbi:immunoglobulin-like domain-containing protein [Maledivibacter halophilus]|uniref:The GLUG motif-containing protein n=1 Tax=Maledivibacter halophilus TaxID=36842 RepID=A0A1T5JYW9_9FIRM|nr:immunoglobulin-like domain-containing protein [Maledivibacter halophilus]SKC56520.1 The GLUG motif-containing protein [Maledivibacter halophilus]